MALSVAQQKSFRNWMIKSASVPLLSVVCFFSYWSWEHGFAYFPMPKAIPFHLSAAALLLFGGFPLWNIILEEGKKYLLLYHGIHFLATFSFYIFMPTNPMIPEPAEFCLIVGGWCLAKEALGFLMPLTDKRIEDFVNWRRDTLDTIVEAHYN